MSRSSVVLPQPDDPTTAVVLPGFRLEVDVMQHGVAVERLREFAGFKGVGGGRHSAATLVDCRNSTSVTGIASTTKTNAYGAAAA